MSEHARSGRLPDTAYPPAERTDAAVLQDEIARAARSPLLTALLEANGSAAAVVDHNRQIVALNTEERPDRFAFRVWNSGTVPVVVVPRIFQRHFSTKHGQGRGQGTYAMKLFGEQLLGGRVSFTSSAPEGTWFEIALPLAKP